MPQFAILGVGGNPKLFLSSCLDMPCHAYASDKIYMYTKLLSLARCPLAVPSYLFLLLHFETIWFALLHIFCKTVTTFVSTHNCIWRVDTKYLLFSYILWVNSVALIDYIVSVVTTHQNRSIGCMQCGPMLVMKHCQTCKLVHNYLARWIALPHWRFLAYLKPSSRDCCTEMSGVFFSILTDLSFLNVYPGCFQKGVWI